MPDLEDIYAALERMHLIEAGTRPALQPLTGGVSSEIYAVQLPTRKVCIKRSLAQLKVQQPWFAPVERGDYEVAWLRLVAKLDPQIVPQVLGADARAHLFAMSYLPPREYPVWKRQLLDGVIDPAFAGQVGHCLGLIHKATANDAKTRARFDNDFIFDPIRIDPYLRATARAHPECAQQLHALAARTLREKHVLVHGDVSPKNLLAGPDGPIFLDAECAWYGDPAFDLAFCLNHLLLKCVWWRDNSQPYLSSFDRLASNYLGHVDWEPRAALEARAATLLGAFLLARIDGKSPVEYLTAEADKALVRSIAVPLIQDEVNVLHEIRRRWTKHFPT